MIFLRSFLLIFVCVAIILLIFVFSSYCKHYWKSNTRLLKAGWNAMKLLRKHTPIELFATQESFLMPNESESVPSLEQEKHLFCSFCNLWQELYGDTAATIDLQHTNGERERVDNELLKKLDFIPVDFAQYICVDSKILSDNWFKFATSKCSKYYDKLICSNGLVFDWRSGKVFDSTS